MNEADPLRDVSLRSVTPEDRDFLFRLYASTREEELAPVPWCAADKQAFLQMQFAAQSKAYSENYPGARFDVICRQGEPIGRLYVHPRETEIRVVDIALLPDYRNQGIGTALLQRVLAEGQAQGKIVTIHVEKFNPAQQLYGRLGFQPVAENGVYYLMEWRPQ